jgi:membrane-bound lytic murein transglycosylase B
LNNSDVCGAVLTFALAFSLLGGQGVFSATTTASSQTGASAQTPQPAAGAKSDDECATREECEALLRKYEVQLVQYEADMQKTASEKKTLQNQIYSLKKKAEGLALKIKQSNAVITDLKFQISDTEKSVQQTSDKIAESQKNLSEIIRVIDQEDKKPLVELLLSEKELSDFFDNLVYLENLNNRSSLILRDIKSLKASLEDQKVGLEDGKADLEKEVTMQTLQKQEHEKNKTEQEKVLKITEVEYQKSLQGKQAAEKKVAAIKSRIFELAGLGKSKAPNFEEAYNIAKSVGALVGVRPAFLLAILTQESNIGKNVGQCYLKNSETGSGLNIRSGGTMAKVMNPTRDVPHFLAVTKDVGRDPFATQVSCPMSFGWGGAMGPAQFIPSTWILYKPRIDAMLKRPADPWNIRDAFLAAALYVSDYGATSKTNNGEWRAAMIYFAGSVNNKYRFYGDNVMAIAAGYADDIAAIEGK